MTKFNLKLLELTIESSTGGGPKKRRRFKFDLISLVLLIKFVADLLNDSTLI